MTPKIKINLVCRKCEGNTGEAEEQKEKLCDGVQTVWNTHILVTG